MDRPTCLAAAVLLLVTTAGAWAEEATDAFESLYGQDLKRVTATPSPADDVALAKQLLEAAQAAEKQPAFLAILCDKAYELGDRDPSGYDTALAAMHLEAEKVPTRKVECLSKVAGLYQGQYAKARLDAKTKAGEALIQALASLADAQAAAGDAEGAAGTLRQALSVATAVKSDSRSALQTRRGPHRAAAGANATSRPEGQTPGRSQGRGRAQGTRPASPGGDGQSGRGRPVCG